MLPSANALPVRRSLLHRSLLFGLIFAVGCSGTGSSCAGGLITTTSPDGGPFRFTGTNKLDNTVQLRLTQDLFNQLNASTLNGILAGLGNGTASSTYPGALATIPCTKLLDTSACISGFGTRLSILAGDTNFNGHCDAADAGAADATPIYLKFNSVDWVLDPHDQVLKANIYVNIHSGDFYLRTGEAHSSIYSDSAGAPAPFQGDIQIDDSSTICPIGVNLDGGAPCKAGMTTLSLAFSFTEAPDGRLLVNITQQSLDNLLKGIDIGGLLHITATPGDNAHPLGNPVPPTYGETDGFNGCDTDNQQFLTLKDNGALTGSGWIIGGGCGSDSTSIGCQIISYVVQYLQDYLTTAFQSQIVGFLQQQIDNIRCQRAVTFDGGSAACASNSDCPKDDNGAATVCVTSRGVCVASTQALDAGPGSACEPTPLAIQGTLDLTNLTQTVGFPAGTKMNLFVGLGGKTAPAAVDDGGIQFAAVAATQPASTVVPALCVPPTTFPPIDTNTIPAMNFDDLNNQPDGGIGVYDVGVSVASKLLNSASYDAFNSGVFCIQISNKTSSYVSTQLFKSFLPSLKLLTGGSDAPMAILLRPTLAPSIRVGRGTFAENDAGTDVVPRDPLVTLSLPKLNLDFYAVIDNRWVRLFTLQADVSVPLGLRTFPGQQADTIQPVLGDLTQVITNISSSDNVMLAEDPSVVTDLLGAVVQFAQPLLAGLLKPIALPQLLGLQLQVKGIAGAVPVSSNIAVDGYNHLAIWAAIAPASSRVPGHSTQTSARLAASDLPESIEELRGPNRKVPAAIIEASAMGAINGPAEFSYRIDGGLWSPWLRESRFTVRNPMFFVQGHHTIEVTSRDMGDDRTQDLNPVSIDFLSSYEAPTAELAQLNDGRVVTHAKSQASTEEQLRYSYKVGDGAWSAAGPARAFTAEELNGHALNVRVIDERGMTTESRFDNGELVAKSLSASGCATAPGAASWALLPLCCVGLVLALRRRRSAQ